MKLFMIPHTVPNRPTNGAVAPMVASTPVPRLARRPLAAASRSRLAATRSLRPSRSSRAPPDNRHSSRAAARKASARGSISAASRLGAWDSATSARFCRRVSSASSRLLATSTIQVINDATSRPIITAFTTQSACRNMPSGVRSWGRVSAPAGDAAAGASIAGAVAGSPASPLAVSSTVVTVVVSPLAGAGWAPAGAPISKNRTANSATPRRARLRCNMRSSQGDASTLITKPAQGFFSARPLP